MVRCDKRDATRTLALAHTDLLKQAERRGRGANKAALWGRPARQRRELAAALAAAHGASSPPPPPPPDGDDDHDDAAANTDSLVAAIAAVTLPDAARHIRLVCAASSAGDALRTVAAATDGASGGTTALAALRDAAEEGGTRGLRVIATAAEKASQSLPKTGAAAEATPPPPPPPAPVAAWMVVPLRAEAAWGLLEAEGRARLRTRLGEDASGGEILRSATHHREQVVKRWLRSEGRRSDEAVRESFREDLARTIEHLRQGRHELAAIARWGRVFQGYSVGRLLASAQLSKEAQRFLLAVLMRMKRDEEAAQLREQLGSLRALLAGKMEASESQKLASGERRQRVGLNPVA